MTRVEKKQDALFTGPVAARDAGKRLDLWLRERNPLWSRKKIKQLLDNHQVTVNRQVVYVASWALKTGDRIVVHAEKREKDAFVQVVFEDKFLLVVDKPPYQSFDETVKQIAAYLKRKLGPEYHPNVVALHRLDKNTSGLFIVAKDPRGAALVDQFKNHTLRKTYLAIVQGQVSFSQKRVIANVKKGQFKGGQKVEVHAPGQGGKYAETDMRVLERYATATLLELTPKTGRTHQIRAHLTSLGYPLVGDLVYTAPGAAGIRFPRHALHAYQLQFIHPMSGQKMKLTAPLPKDMQGLLDQLRS